ncbi:hypothetical protein [Pseudoalteromonas rubra]|uniref:Uncharacterized protein n=1 Tax=Pseudoalteromonas rubra TaxID=43658 RepID=A0A5S3X0H4_9GAMM|nr:hypothetical protein [Pseudoalteromonas rubra]TMP37404.1 hypothetical protein CWB98_11805 [Pseudoalteromonas rubra]
MPLLHFLSAQYALSRCWACLVVVSALNYFSYSAEQFFSLATLNLLVGLTFVILMNDYKLGLPMYVGPPDYKYPDKPEFKQRRHTWYVISACVFWCCIGIQSAMLLFHSIALVV